MTPILELNDLTRSFAARGRRGGAVQALRGVSLCLEAGRSVALVGESGSGKSTLARIAAGLAAPSSGQVIIDGRRPGDLPRAERHALLRQVQMVFQDPLTSLDPRKRIGVQLMQAVAVGAPGLSRPAARSRVAELLADVGLNDSFAGHFPHQLSGGQRQRVVIARALAPRPRVLICDEPLAALDVSVQAQMIALLRQLQAQSGLTLLFITHQLSTVRHLCEDMAVLYAGKIVEQGAVGPMLRAPRHPYTRMLLSSVPDPRRVDHGDEGVTGDPPDPANLPQGCAFAPRCPRWSNLCTETDPRPERLGDRLLACHVPLEAGSALAGAGIEPVA